MGEKLTNLVTAVGELHHVNITGQGKQNYNEDGYVYVANVYLPKDKAQPHIDLINEVLGPVGSGQKLKSVPYRELMKDDDGLFLPTTSEKSLERQKGAKPSGIICFMASTSTTFDDGKTKKIKVYNSAKPPSVLNMGDKMIGNGSKGAISGKLQRYEKGKKGNTEVGVSYFLNAVQLVDFVEYSGDAGFSEQEGGFTGFSEAMPETEGPATDSGKPEQGKSTSKPKL